MAYEMYYKAGDMIYAEGLYQKQKACFTVKYAVQMVFRI